MKKAIVGFTKFVLETIFTVAIVAGIMWFMIQTGIMEAVVTRGAELLQEHVRVEDHFEGVEISSDGINTVYSRRLVIE